MGDIETPVITGLCIEDIPHLVECIQRCYGDTYPIKMMYDEGALKEIIESNRMHSVIAKNTSGEVVGHCALIFEGEHNALPEAGRMLVDPEYRGHHISEELAKHRVEIAKKIDLIGFWSACVTNHPYSQHEMIALGGFETGALLSVAPPDVVMQGLQNFSDSRRSVLAYYRPLIPNKKLIYIPDRHTELVKKLSEQVQLERTIQSSHSVASGKTKLTVDLHELNHSANIDIQHIGEDLIHSLSQEINKLDHFQLAAVFLNLPINEPAASQACIDLEDLGFFWGAWIPNYLKNGDIFRLQKMNHSINPDEIICAREQGEIIKKYVLSEWQRVSPSTLKL